MNNLYIWIIFGVICGCGIAVAVYYFSISRKSRQEEVDGTVKIFTANILGVIKRLTVIHENKDKAEPFSIKEVLQTVVIANQIEKLRKKDRFYVVKLLTAIIDKYGDENIYLTDKDYNLLYHELAFQFDMVAPYRKFCGEKQPILNEKGKKEYRKKARELIDKNLLFSQDWESLKTEFIKKFN